MRGKRLLLVFVAVLVFVAEYEALPEESSGVIARPGPQNEVRLEKSRMIPMRAQCSCGIEQSV